MRFAGIVCLLTIVASTAAGCAGADDGQAARVARAFVEAARSGDGTRACELLAPQATASLATGGLACAEEVTGLSWRPPEVRAVQVWGGNAQVELADRTVFLSHFPRGWLVTAAGCRPVGSGRYDCELEA